MGKYSEAEKIYRTVFQNILSTGLKDHPLVLAGSVDYVEALIKIGKSSEAFEIMEDLITSYGQRLTRQMSKSLSDLTPERNIVRESLERQISLLFSDNENQKAEYRSRHVDQAFRLTQLIRSIGAAEAINKMGARFAGSDNDLAKIIRVRQDAVANWRSLDSAMIASIAVSGGMGAELRQSELAKERMETENRIANLDRQISSEFPEYYELISSKPLNGAEVQKLIGKDEALLVYLTSDVDSFVWVLRSDRIKVAPIDLTRSDLNQQITELRKGLHPQGVTSLSQVPPFDRNLAYGLYKKLIKPIEPDLAGVRSVMIVPDGGLQAIPMGLLITEPPSQTINNLGDYRHESWLIRRFALAILPSVNSLRALRIFASGSHATKPFKGFGDPALDGEEGITRGVEQADLFTRGAVANVNEVRKLNRLPETREELEFIAQSLGAGKSDLFLGEAATEKAVKDEDLSDVRVLAFATHGLLGGHFSGVHEPSLVFTPPDEGNETDDGLLKASEAAQLKLNADWVILSACDTAAADGSPDGEGLSGLARAFFYAGARSLLVSHWPVLSNAAKKITGELFSDVDMAMNEHAIALQDALVKIINDEESPFLSHPMFWASFSLVGV
tara:strand:- start:45 stop:1892 length:1848 start_codon:yes stop_codon:yes gene_type:complete